MDDYDIEIILLGLVGIVLGILLLVGFSAGIAYLLAYGIATVTSVEYGTGLFVLCFGIVALIIIMFGD